jgi:hypothetical protein
LNKTKKLFEMQWNQNIFRGKELLRQGNFNPFGPKKPTPRRRKRKPPRFEFLGAVGLVLGMLAVIGFLLFHLIGFQVYLLVSWLLT